MPVALYDLYFIRKNLNELLTDCAPASPPVVDALTGQPLSRLPVAVIPGRPCQSSAPARPHRLQQTCRNMLQHANKLTRQIEDLYEKRYGDPYHYEEEMEEEEKANKPANLEEIRRHLTDFLVSLQPFATSVFRRITYDFIRLARGQLAVAAHTSGQDPFRPVMFI